MKYIHTGLAARSEEKADYFFINILGLEKAAPKILDKNIAQSIFGINDELVIINYKNEYIHYEILVYGEYKPPEKQISHSCIGVTGLKNIHQEMPGCRFKGC